MRSGFTLLEIVPVLALIVILMTIVIVAINPFKQFGDARNTQRKQDIHLIAESFLGIGSNQANVEWKPFGSDAVANVG